MNLTSPVAASVSRYPTGCKVRTSDPREPIGVPWSGENEAEDSQRPITVEKMFLSTVNRFPDNIALRYKESDQCGSQDQWKDVTYTDYYKYSYAAAKSFVTLGVEPSSCVTFMGLISPESVIGYFGSVFAGGIFMGLRVDGTPEGNIHMLNTCKARVILVETAEQVHDILQIRENLTYLKAIVQYRGSISEKCHNLYSWRDFMEVGKAVKDSVIEERLKQQQPGSCVSMVSTSGTTGHYKIAMLSHDNLVWSAKMLHRALSPHIGFGVDRFVTRHEYYYISCLNLDVFLSVYCAACLHFSPPSATKDMRVHLPFVSEVKPTLFFGSTIDWDGVRSVLEEKGINKPESAKVFLGLQDCRVFLTAGATLPEELHEYFKRLSISIIEAYGLTENAGGVTINMEPPRPRSAGKPNPGVHVRIENSNRHGNGEILVYGRQRFMGYLYDEDETVKTIDDTGWLHTGDIGHIDDEGYLYITGRLKEMIVLSDANNIAPVPIEMRIKRELPFLSNVVVVGDGQRYLCCLVTLKTVTDPQSRQPLDTLAPAALAQISQLGSHCTRASEIVRLRDEVVHNAIQRGIDNANEVVHFKQDCVKRFMIIEPDFSTFGGEIGETSKLRRHVVKEKYHEQIKAMYEE